MLSACYLHASISSNDFAGAVCSTNNKQTHYHPRRQSTSECKKKVIQYSVFGQGSISSEGQVKEGDCLKIPVTLEFLANTVHTGYSAIGYTVNLYPHFWSHLLIC